ncbi:MAG: SsrA-binding protein [Cyanobacteria bacterium QS_8_64_29]|nr:MAG: SsrA-binding protein [Cyanobacteria bacterium QS_8_64_29]
MNGGITVVSENRQARFLYEIQETYEAGIQLTGTEIKSVRAGRANLRDGYAIIRNREVWLLNVHIAPFQGSGQYFNHEPRRTRKLLLHRREIDKLSGKIQQKGFTLVPVKLYLARGLAKVSLGLAKGKKKYDKRETIKQREAEKEMQRVVKRF